MIYLIFLLIKWGIITPEMAENFNCMEDLNPYLEQLEQFEDADQKQNNGKGGGRPIWDTTEG